MIVDTRPSKTEYYLSIAKVVASRSTCLRRQYGAVIVKNDEIVSTGYNGSPRGSVNCCDKGICKRVGHAHNDGDYSSCESVHAEMNAIISASRSEMIGATLYLYGQENGMTIRAEPCPICSRMIRNSGIAIVQGSSEDYDG
jgi:dCMP deaminase